MCREASWRARSAELLEERGGAEFDGCLRIVLTRGGRRLLLTEPLPPTPERVRLGVVEYAPTRVLDGIKSLSYGANMLCGRLARERGFDEALLVTPHGRVLEAPTSSFFWVDSAGTLNTPPLSEHILASITRDRVMEVADVTERPCTMDDLREASEAFLASTTSRGTVDRRDRGHRAARAASARARRAMRCVHASRRSWPPASASAGRSGARRTRPRASPHRPRFSRRRLRLRLASLPCGSSL